MQFDTGNEARGLLDLSALIIEEDLCINLRGRMMLCSACLESCPSEALSLSVDAVDLDKEKCTACNSCMSECDAGALRSSGFIPDRFLSTLSAMTEVDLHCRESKDEGGGVVIPCHQVLDKRLIAAARADGLEVITLHGLNHCESCERGDARAYIDSLRQQLNAWMGERATEIRIASADSKRMPGNKDYQDQAAMDRRSFLRFGGARTVQSLAKWFVPGMTQQEEEETDLLPFYQVDEFQQRPSFYLSPLFSRIQQVPWTENAELPWQMRTVSESCSACLSCGERCPTGALQSEQTPQLRSLSFDPALCTNCQLCEKICPEQAFISQPLLSIPEVTQGRILLNQVAQSMCVQCGSAFIAKAEAQICSVCENEQELDDEWLDMLSG